MTTSSELDVFGCPLDGISLIEASAGTGKTWNICGLYLRLLLERRLEVQQILVVTFTNAATAELRERIRSRLVETLRHLQGGAATAADPFVPLLIETLQQRRGLEAADMARRLDLALQTFDEAAIFTIHGYCQRALADTPFSAQLPLALELIQDDSELRREAVNDFWRRHIAGDGLSAELAAFLDEKQDSPEKFARLLQRHLAKPLAERLWPDAIDQPATLHHGALADAHAAARATWTSEREAIVARLIDGCAALHANSYKPESVQRGAAEWDRFFQAGDPFAPLPLAELKVALYRSMTLQKRTKKGCATPEHVFFDQTETFLGLRAAADQARQFGRLRLIRALLDSAGGALRARKREQRLISFDDMLFNVHERLTRGDGPRLAAALRQRFPAALVDEFQDTDPLQFAIFKAIYGSGDAPAFLVGDPKQAIYRFRNADLHTYLQARREASAEYSLAENQRSSAGLIAALNALFSANDRAFMLPGLTYREVGCGARERKAFEDRSEPRADLQLWLLPQQDGAPIDKRDARRLALGATAAEIGRLLGEASRGHVQLDGRALRAGDIAVLVRSHRQGSEMRRALAALGIASVELSQASIYRSAEAEEVERVLTAVLEPGRERLLRAALATELIGCDAAAIEAIAGDESRLLQRIERFSGYRETWQRRGPGVMFRQLLSEEDVSRRMLARADGERRLTNLLHLAECLHQAAQMHPAPEALLRWLQAQRRDEVVDDALQLRLESDRNLVQIVTIHKAKGLEYPVVFCPFLWDAGMLPASSTEGLEYHDDQGRTVIDFRGEFVDEAATRAIKAQTRLEESAEVLRLIYVALTRAIYRCYLVAGCHSTKTTRGDSTTISTTESGRSLLNWLVAGQGQTPPQWFEGKPAPAAIEAAWTRLAERGQPHIAIAALPTQPGVPVSPPRRDPATLSALPAPAFIPAGWRISSYSGLSFGAVNDNAASDHDARAGPGAAVRPLVGPALDADDVLHFPRGAVAGECVHAVFERIDFGDRSGWDAAIGDALRAHPQSLPGVSAELAQPRLAAMLTRLVGDVTRTELPDGIRLDAIAPERRLSELEFSLPSRGLEASDLNPALHALGYAAPRLTFGRLEGYLKGFIDLVFEHRGRFYLLDWKSNHLGYSAADYSTEPVAAAMASHGYHLQHLLYCVALGRYLRRRVPGYDHEQHFGGAVYLFVRGVRPGWRNADGSATGVYFDRPSAATLHTLDALLDADDAAMAHPA